jgi:hypothetical protein
MNVRMCVVPLLLMAASCVPKPERSYTPEQVSEITSLEEVMHLLAHRADPLFGIREQTNFSQEEYAHMAQAAEIIVAAGAHLESFVGQESFDDGFGTHAKELGQHGAALLEATESSNPRGAGEALSAVKNSCKDCHSAYR